jgi:hypothetical protein
MGAFKAEIASHFPGWKSIDRHAVFVYPELVIVWLAEMLSSPSQTMNCACLQTMRLPIETDLRRKLLPVAYRRNAYVLYIQTYRTLCAPKNQCKAPNVEAAIEFQRTDCAVSSCRKGLLSAF